MTELLEASSAKLCNHSVITTLREESSDESTVISSQASTLTRNQGNVTTLLQTDAQAALLSFGY